MNAKRFCFQEKKIFLLYINAWQRGVPTTSIISQQTSKLGTRLKLRHIPFITWSDTQLQYIICIFLNINETVKKLRVNRTKTNKLTDFHLKLSLMHVNVCCYIIRVTI